MKKFLVILLLFLLPILVDAEVCDTNKISIESIELEDKSVLTDELAGASVNGKSINLNLSMAEVGDNAKYKIVVNNESNEDYEIDNSSLNSDSDYIDYQIETDDNSNIVNAHSKKTVYLKVKYKNKVPATSYVDGKYNNNSTLVVNLSSDNNGAEIDKTVENIPAAEKTAIEVPDTEAKTFLIVISVLVAALLITYLIVNKKTFSIFILLIGILIIPVVTNAICKCDLKVDSSIQIVQRLEPQLFRYRISEREIYITGYDKELATLDINYQIDDKNKCEEYFKNYYSSVDSEYYDRYPELKEDLFTENEVETSAKRICSGLKDKYSWTLVNFIYSEVLPSDNYSDAGLSNVSRTLKEVENGEDVIIPDHIIGLPVTVIDSQSFNGIHLNSVKFPNTLREIYGGTEEGTFFGCGLTHIELPESLETIGHFAFNSNNLTEVVIPDNVKEIGTYAFAFNSISSLTLGKNVEAIYYGAFYENNLTTVTIPSSVRYLYPDIIGFYFFSRAFGCNPLTSVIIEGKSSYSEFDSIPNGQGMPFSWDSNVTCIIDNEENIENGCITWMGNK